MVGYWLSFGDSPRWQHTRGSPGIEHGGARKEPWAARHSDGFGRGRGKRERKFSRGLRLRQFSRDPSFTGQIDSLVTRCVDWCNRYGIAPANIFGHRDFVTTKPCPGNNLYSLLPSVRRLVNSELHSSSWAAVPAAASLVTCFNEDWEGA